MENENAPHERKMKMRSVNGKWKYAPSVENKNAPRGEKENAPHGAKMKKRTVSDT